MSNSYIFILITIYFLKIISSKNNNFPFYLSWQKNLLEKNCIENVVYCPMISAIADIFKQIQQEEIEANSNNICYNLCLTYNSIHARDMICESIDTIYDKDSKVGEIIFGNCNVLISGEIGYENREYKNINFGTFLSELNIPSMTFSHAHSLEKMEFEYENATTKFNFDNSRAIFNSVSENLTEHMEYILNKVYDEFISKIKDKIEPVLSRTDILTDTKNKIYQSFTFFNNGPALFDENKNVTYISYNKIEQFEKIIIKEKIIFYNLKVDFQYALNNNITYNEGLFFIKDVIFEANEGINNIFFEENISEMYKQADIDNLNNKNEIWEIIINDFKKKFNDYKVDNSVNTKKAKFF